MQIMSANFYCWEKELALKPGSAEFETAIQDIHKPPYAQPSEKMLNFVDALLRKYPDLTETDDTVWSDGPLRGNIIGQFINLGIMWSGYEEAIPFVIATAHSFHLHCYDPQDGSFYPVSGADG